MTTKVFTKFPDLSAMARSSLSEKIMYPIAEPAELHVIGTVTPVIYFDDYTLFLMEKYGDE